MPELDFVYLATDGKWLKIGASDCVESRMRYLSSPRGFTINHPVKLLRVWHVPSAARCVEAHVKKKFKRCRAHGGSYEWFKNISAQDIIDVIEAVPFMSYLREKKQSKTK